MTLLHIVQTGSGAHPASFPMSTGGSFPGVKLPGREADTSPQKEGDHWEVLDVGGRIILE
jgi:hypothetical protein